MDNQLDIMRKQGFNPRETADNLKKSGAFIPGIRPGEQTSKYIDKVMTRLTLAGALYITFICLITEFMMIAWNMYLSHQMNVYGSW